MSEKPPVPADGAPVSGVDPEAVPADASASPDTPSPPTTPANAGTPGGTPPSSGAAQWERRNEGPRRVRGGQKLRWRDTDPPMTGVAGRIIDLLDASVTPAVRQEGIEYARQGQILVLEMDGGAVRATVQGRRRAPYDTRLHFDVIAPEDWDRIVDAMASEAAYLVSLLADELPDGIDELLETLDLRLVPPAPLATECDCADAAPCKHAAAAGLLAAERLQADPALMLGLRGMPLERLRVRLRQARALQAHGVASAHVDPMIPESQVDPPALETCLDAFWRPPPGAADPPPPTKHLSHALLRRLGPSPLTGKFPFVGLLASIYDHVAEHARELEHRLEE
ncbi:MAG: hypothetical protein HKO59_03370 [Phycisphaerales bacterium]|nr:hypothetical protein [Phycisphaerae bacterium]NNM25022.1 hypothetical protein [Phycisphaerales bacterium]